MALLSHNKNSLKQLKMWLSELHVALRCLCEGLYRRHSIQSNNHMISSCEGTAGISYSSSSHSYPHNYFSPYQKRYYRETISLTVPTFLYFNASSGCLSILLAVHREDYRTVYTVLYPWSERQVMPHIWAWVWRCVTGVDVGESCPFVYTSCC
jgi:hypothetical protein